MGFHRAAACRPFHSLRSIAAALSILIGLTAPAANAAPPPPDPSPTVATVTVFATRFNNPRVINFGPEGNLYVAEGGAGGPLSAHEAQARRRGDVLLEPLLARCQGRASACPAGPPGARRTASASPAARGRHGRSSTVCASALAAAARRIPIARPHLLDEIAVVHAIRKCRDRGDDFSECARPLS
jgi:hypothetical protein